MPKYGALQLHLSRLQRDEWNATFAQIEEILGFNLPASARKYPAWWANQSDGGHSQSQAWLEAGWQTSDLDLSGSTVRFQRKGRAGHSYDVASSADQSLFEEARRYSGIEEEDELVKEGMRALIEREAARRLARLGGTMPDYAPPPRRRDE